MVLYQNNIDSMTQVDRLDSQNGRHIVELYQIFIKIQVQVRSAL